MSQPAEQLTGKPAMLKDKDFQVLEDGKKQKVTLFSGERRPLPPIWR